MDEHEVTNEAYAAYLERTGAVPPPDQCGYDDYGYVEPEPLSRAPEVSGWIDGEVDADRRDHPAVCVTRMEAMAYCEERGGHLPTVFEWARTVRDLYPDSRRFPWGDTPPPEHAAPWPDTLGYWFLHYSTLGTGESGLRTSPIASAPGGTSPAGLVDVSGSVAELLSTCGEELAGTPAEIEPLVRPDGGGRAARCAARVVIAGSSWRSLADPQFSFASTIYLMGGAAETFEYPDATHGLYADPSIVQSVLGAARPLGPVTDEAGNDRRSWQLGWRCAYDAPAR